MQKIQRIAKNPTTTAHTPRAHRSRNALLFFQIMSFSDHNVGEHDDCMPSLEVVVGGKVQTKRPREEGKSAQAEPALKKAKTSAAKPKKPRKPPSQDHTLHVNSVWCLAGPTTKQAVTVGNVEFTTTVQKRKAFLVIRKNGTTYECTIPVGKVTRVAIFGEEFQVTVQKGNAPKVVVPKVVVPEEVEMESEDSESDDEEDSVIYVRWAGIWEPPDGHQSDPAKPVHFVLGEDLMFTLHDEILSIEDSKVKLTNDIRRALEDCLQDKDWHVDSVVLKKPMLSIPDAKKVWHLLEVVKPESLCAHLDDSLLPDFPKSVKKLELVGTFTPGYPRCSPALDLRELKGVKELTLAPARPLEVGFEKFLPPNTKLRVKADSWPEDLKKPANLVLF
jgi:hypothetical protein